MRLLLALAAALLSCAAAMAETPAPLPVAIVADGRLPVENAVLPVFVSQDWSRPLPAIRRVVIIVHGDQRNAADYARIIQRLAGPDTLVVAPQFLADEDVAAHRLPPDTLSWQRELWAGGYPADSPDPWSAFHAIDALLTRLADRSMFPNLSRVVLAGFSAGGQLVQRYAIVGNGEALLSGTGASLRYVVGSPSSYAYFGAERPHSAAGCEDVDVWKYGFGRALPPYVAQAAANNLPALERRYAAREIVYLVGGNDTDPNHRSLDRSCAAETQGPTRLARTRGFLAILRRRDGALPRQWLAVVKGAGHQAQQIFASPCGRAALFDRPGCLTR